MLNNTATGNNGPKPVSITTPGISRNVITVGSSDDELMTDCFGNRLYNYSGRGPTAFCIVKPEVVAPGSNIFSCSNRNNNYIVKSGTSMSTPIVSGIIALTLEKYPNLSPKDVKIKIFRTSKNLGLPKNRQGWGLINLVGMLN